MNRNERGRAIHAGKDLDLARVEPSVTARAEHEQVLAGIGTAFGERFVMVRMDEAPRKRRGSEVVAADR